MWRTIPCVCAFFRTETRFNQTPTEDGIQTRLTALPFQPPPELVGKAVQARGFGAGEGVSLLAMGMDVAEKGGDQVEKPAEQPCLPEGGRRPLEPRKSVLVLKPLLSSSRFSREVGDPTSQKLFGESILTSPLRCRLNDG